jgi:hypothetical protein
VKRTWRQLLVVGPALVVLVLAGVLATRQGGSGGSAGSGPDRPSVPLVSAPPPSRGSPGPAFGTEVARPTSTPAQSKLWFASGSWWGALYAPAAGEWRIHWFEWSTQRWQDTGTPLDERTDARIDALFDGTSLVVASAGRQEDNARSGLRVARYRFDEARRRWSLDAGYPVTVVPNGVTGPTIARDSTGVLWVSYVAGGTPFVARSSGSDARWGTPFALPDASAGRVEQAALAADGAAVGVLWTEVAEDAVHAALHADGAPTAEWRTDVVEVAGRGREGNALVLRGVPAAEGRAATFVAAVQTLPQSGEPRNTLGPGLVVVEGGGGERWRTSRVSTITDVPGTPVLVVDGAARRVSVATVSRDNPRAMFVKWAHLDELVFPSGPGTQLLLGRSPSSRLLDPTSTKQVLGPESGLLVLVADDGRSEYMSGAAAFGGPEPGTPSVGDEHAPPTSGEVELLAEDFQSGAVGAALDPLWRLRSDDPSGSTSIVAAGADGALAGRVTTGFGGRSTQVCRSFGVVTGNLSTNVDVLLDGAQVGGAVLTGVRGDREVAAVRVSGRGRIGWWQGAEQVQTDLDAQPGRWYRLTTTVHVATKTWDFVLFDRSNGAVLASANGLAWRDPRDTSVDDVCFRSPDGVGAGLVLDNLEVQR